MTSAAIYARVSSARQAKDETIGSQLAALREHAAASRLDVPEEWVFADEGHSGATLVRPGLEALRDLAAHGCLDVLLVYSPDRLARKFAYQTLLIEELACSGVRVEFVKGPRGDSPGASCWSSSRACSPSTRRPSSPGGTAARYQVIPHEAVLVAEMFRRYADEGAAIADLRRWLEDQG